MMKEPPSNPEARNGAPLPARGTRRQREIAYADARLRAEKATGRPLRAVRHLRWLMGRCRVIGLTSAATRLVEVIASLMGRDRALHGKSLAYLARCLDWSRQRASFVYKLVEATGVVARIGKSFYLRTEVLEQAEVEDRNRRVNVNGALRIPKEDKRERQRGNPDALKHAWHDLINSETGSDTMEHAVKIIMASGLGISREVVMTFRN